MNLHRAAIAFPLIPMATALAARLHGLSDKPLWLDEIITQRRANLPISNLIENSLYNKQFPTYFIFVRAFDAPIINEWTLRLPSAIFSAIAVLLVTLIATEIQSRRAGVIAGVLMALSPFEVQLGQEARSYSLVSCFVFLALWGLVRIAKQLSSEASLSRPPNRLLGSWAAYTIGTIGAINVLLVAAPWLLASNLAMAAIIWRSRSKQRELARNWIIAQAIILLTWLPGLVAMYLVADQDPLRGFHWLPLITLKYLWAVISDVYLFRPSDIITFEPLPTPFFGFGAAVVALALLGAWRLRANPMLLSVIGIAVIAMPITITVVSIVHAMLVPRYLIWSAGPFFVLAGVGTAALPRKLFPLAAIAIAVGAMLNLAPYYRYETKPRWDLAAAYLASNVQPGDSIFTNDDMAHYVLGAYGDRYHLDRKGLNTVFNTSDVTSRYAQEGQVWIVYGRTGQGSVDSEETFVKNWSVLGAPVSKKRFGQHVIVLHFDKNSKTDLEKTGANNILDP